MLSFLRFFLLASCITITSSLRLMAPQYQRPKIYIDEIIQQDHFYFDRDLNQNWDDYYTLIDSDYIISPSTSGLTLRCNASYPVYWKVDDSDLNASDMQYTFEYDILTHTERSGELTDSKESWGYSAVLRFYILSSEMTRNYTCVSAQDEKMQTSRYLFIQGNAQKYLFHSGQEFTFNLYSSQDPFKKVKVVTAPCRLIVRDPQEIQLKLYKEKIIIGTPFNSSTWELLSTNDSITYDPRKGYSFIVDDLPDIISSYKCAADEENNPMDVIHFDIIYDKQRFSTEKKVDTVIRNVMHGSASLGFNYFIGQVHCCSNSDKPPTIKIVSCRNRPECELHKSLASQAPVHPEWYYYSYPDESLPKNCASAYFGIPSFWLRCQGDDIDIFDLYSYSFNSTDNSNVTAPTPTTGSGNYHHHYMTPSCPSSGYTMYQAYFPSKSRDNHDHLLKIEYQPLPHYQPVKNPEGHIDDYNYNYYEIDNPDTQKVKGPLYSGEQIWVKCYKSTFMFSEGHYFTLGYKDGTTKELISQQTYPEGVLRLMVTADINLVNVSCTVPVWNSTEWITKSISISAQASIAPKMDNPDYEHKYWTINDTDRTIECEFSGIPTPTIIWEKDGKNLDSSKTLNISQVGGKGRLHFLSKISHDLQGEYKCSGQNSAGKWDKVITVFVGESSTSHTVLTLGVVFTLLIVCGILAAVIWKSQIHRKILNNMNSATFQEPS